MTDAAGAIVAGRDAGDVVQEDLARNHDDGDAAALERIRIAISQDARQLFGNADQLCVDAALAEQLLRVRLLEVAAADLRARDMRGDRQHRDAAAVGVEQPVDRDGGCPARSSPRTPPARR